jgi:hypothetical protein
MTELTPEERLLLLEEAAEKNTAEHKQIIELITPMSDTFKTIRLLGKWIAAIVVFCGVLGGAIWTFINIFDRFRN